MRQSNIAYVFHNAFDRAVAYNQLSSQHIPCNNCIKNPTCFELKKTEMNNHKFLQPCVIG